MADLCSIPIDSFLLRCGLAAKDQLDCHDFIRQLHPGRPISPSLCQGFCSITIFVGDDYVVQFRPHAYRLDLRITQAAQDVYERLAPATSYLGIMPGSGLLAYGMKRIDGISYKDFCKSSLPMQEFMHCRATLCKDFAMFLSKSWYRESAECLPLGKIGKTLQPRLVSLCRDLPSRFRPAAQGILSNLVEIESLPWVFTHGDITAGNIMVRQSTGSLTGFVDWAEAELLPFGICLYGLEEILGEMTSDGFQYHPDAYELRSLFWAELGDLIPSLRQDKILKAVKLARDLGVLLWHGIAFDDGRIDRVVQEEQDIDEIHRLDAFLDMNQYCNPDLPAKI